MLARENFSEEHIRQIQNESHRDPGLIERTLFAFGLLEALSQVGLKFVFKGGTSLMLLLPHPMRLSTDIDIVVDPGTDVDQYILKAKRIFPFKDGGEQERASRGKIEKRHFKFIYDSPMNRGDTLYILLDILFEENHYEKMIQKEIKNDLLLTEGQNLSVTIPSIDCILGDKLTAFAPHTTGIPFGKKNLEIMKQFYDISTLIDEHSNYEVIKRTYFSISNIEIAYRGIDCAPEDALMDTVNAALCIGTRGKWDEEDYPNYLEGSRRVTNHIFAAGFSMEQASRLAPKVICMAVCLLTGVSFESISDPAKYKQEVLSQPDLIHMKGLRRADPIGYAYLVQADRLIGKYRAKTKSEQPGIPLQGMP